MTARHGNGGPQSLDPDMLDERVRTMLGYAQAGDLIVLENERNK